jgi:hypothetical protein
LSTSDSSVDGDGDGDVAACSNSRAERGPFFTLLHPSFTQSSLHHSLPVLFTQSSLHHSLPVLFTQSSLHHSLARLHRYH